MKLLSASRGLALDSILIYTADESGYYEFRDLDSTMAYNIIGVDLISKQPASEALHKESFEKLRRHQYVELVRTGVEIRRDQTVDEAFVKEIHIVGDCAGVRKMRDAIHQGARAGREV
jgi:hypothetical protein